MKKDTHPNTYKVKVTCSCGAKYEIESTDENFTHVEICSACHPFYTGKEKTLDSAGQVDKFLKKWNKTKK